jgi:hypothetical protein
MADQIHTDRIGSDKRDSTQKFGPVSGSCGTLGGEGLNLRFKSQMFTGLIDLQVEVRLVDWRIRPESWFWAG